MTGGSSGLQGLRCVTCQASHARDQGGLQALRLGRCADPRPGGVQVKVKLGFGSTGWLSKQKCAPEPLACG